MTSCRLWILRANNGCLLFAILLAVLMACSTNEGEIGSVGDAGIVGDASLEDDQFHGDDSQGDEVKGDEVKGDEVTDVEPWSFAVLATVPVDGSSDVTVDTPIVVTFNSPVNLMSVTVQPHFGPCDSMASFALSADGFVNCVGGSISAGEEASQVHFHTHGGILATQRSYVLRLTQSVGDLDGKTLAAPYEGGFATELPPCAARQDPTLRHDTGAVCLPPVFVNNDDGTITDSANKLLWLRCSLDGDGQPTDDGAGGCIDPFTLGANGLPDWELAVSRCENLVYAGRDDWTLPDIAQLETLLSDTHTEEGTAFIDPDFFPSSSSYKYHSRSTHRDQPRTSFLVLFGYMGQSAVGHGAKLGPGLIGSHVRCVAGPPLPNQPQLTDLRATTVYSDSILLGTPPVRTAIHPRASRQAWIGPAANMVVVGTTVVNASQGPIDLLALTEDGYNFEGLSANTEYKLVVIAEGGGTSAVSEINASTATIAPLLKMLEISSFSSDSITLVQPAFWTNGNPSPSVTAYIGFDGDIMASDNSVLNHLQGPVDVSSMGHTFHGLERNRTYRIYVVAQNSAGFSVGDVVQRIGRFIINDDGTVYAPDSGLSWWRHPDSHLQYCWEESNVCNGGTPEGILGPPWIGPSPYHYHSLIWEACRESWVGGRSDWRVPTISELETLIDLNYSGDCLDTSAFPTAPEGYYWSANSSGDHNVSILDNPCAIIKYGESKTPKKAYNLLLCVAPGM